MIQVSIVDTLLSYINEYVSIEICDVNTYKIIMAVLTKSEIDETYLGCEVRDFIIDNGLVTIWVEVE